jgi:hypothetical protein
MDRMKGKEVEWGKRREREKDDKMWWKEELR